MKTTIKIFAIVALAMFIMTSCSKKDSDILKKHKVEFSVKNSGTSPTDPADGTLKAAVDGKEIKSGVEVEEGKEVVFTATPRLFNWGINSWTVTGAAAPEGKPSTFTIKITQPVTVTVSFRKSLFP